MPTTDNGTSFADTLGSLFTSGAALATSIGGAAAAFQKPAKPGPTYVINAVPQPQPGQAAPASSGFKLDSNTMMILAVVGIVVLVVAVK